jgi:hypothetical protein
VAFLALEGTLFWYHFHTPESARHANLLTFATLAMLFVLTSTGVIPLPKGSNIPFFGVWPDLSDSIKALASFALIFIWTPLALKLVPETVIGAIVILAPDALFALAALIYLSNGLSRGGSQ